LYSELCTCKASLPLKPHFQSILLWLFWRWGLLNYLPRVALDCDPPNLSLPNTQDYSVIHQCHFFFEAFPPLNVPFLFTLVAWNDCPCECPYILFLPLTGFLSHWL
jgi:hypothetical protein